MQKRTKKIRTGDKVVVLAGNARGQHGNVVAIINDKVVIEGVNMCKKHVKRSQTHQQGGIIEMERPMHISNVCPCDEEGNPVKIKTRTNEQGERELFYVKDEQPVVWRTLKRTK